MSPNDVDILNLNEFQIEELLASNDAEYDAHIEVAELLDSDWWTEFSLGG